MIAHQKRQIGNSKIQPKVEMLTDEALIEEINKRFDVDLKEIDQNQE